MIKIKKLLCIYVATIMLITNTLGVSLAVAQAQTCPTGTCPLAKGSGGTAAHGKAMSSDDPESKNSSQGGCEGGSCGNGAASGGGGGGGLGAGLGAGLGQMMQSLLPLLLLMMMMQPNKNNQPPPPPLAVAPPPPTFTPVQLITAVPTAPRPSPPPTITTRQGAMSDQALFPTLPPIQ
jgi:hypothetical protein